MKKTLLFTLILLAVCITAHAETLTLSTYYPAPLGNYDRMRLVPRSLPTCDANAEGLMVYNNTPTADEDIGIYVCDGVDWDEAAEGIWDADRANEDIFIHGSIADPQVGIGVTAPAHRLEVTDLTDTALFIKSSLGNGYALRAEGSQGAFSNLGFRSGSNDYGIFAEGEEYGGFFRGRGGASHYGVWGEAIDSAGGAQNAYGGRFRAINANTNYGVHATAAVAGNNRAGYFSGVVEVTNDTMIGGDLDVTGNTTVTGDTAVTGDLDVTGTITGSIDAEFNSLHVLGTSQLDGNVGVGRAPSTTAAYDIDVDRSVRVGTGSHTLGLAVIGENGLFVRNSSGTTLLNVSASQEDVYVGKNLGVGVAPGFATHKVHVHGAGGDIRLEGNIYMDDGATPKVLKVAPEPDGWYAVYAPGP